MLILTASAGADTAGRRARLLELDIEREVDLTYKVLGQDVGKALSNFKLLGKMTGDYVVEMTKAAAFTRKLGIEIESLTGLVDKFDEFEGGAEAAAQLLALALERMQIKIDLRKKYS
jgi:hypothetical protein